ncbi:MAG: zinc dependent phospholipase C family protein, partial [Spirochaetia bacterium]|nr:zinc dependent phospholipase C family protein [Spirochaetia bacterium]
RKLSFVLGYISHCAVDIVTHPYIFYIAGDYYSHDKKKAEKAQLNHLRVEYALDSYLVHQRWGMNPHEYNYIQYVDSSLQRKRKILSGRVDPDIRNLWMTSLKSIFPDEFGQFNAESPGKDDPIDESYRDFILFNRILDTGSSSVRMLLRVVDLITFRRSKLRVLLLPPREKIPERMPNEKHALWKYPADPRKTSEESFMDLIHRSARFSNEMMKDAVNYLNGKIRRKEMIQKYSEYNLDTGIRNESIDMKAFEPIEDEA